MRIALLSTIVIMVLLVTGLLYKQSTNLEPTVQQITESISAETNPEESFSYTINQSLGITVWDSNLFKISYPKNWELQPPQGDSCSKSHPTIIKNTGNIEAWLVVCGPSNYDEKIFTKHGKVSGLNGPDIIKVDRYSLDGKEYIYVLSNYNFPTGNEIHIDLFIRDHDKSWELVAKYYPKDNLAINEDNPVIREITEIIKTFELK